MREFAGRGQVRSGVGRALGAWAALAACVLAWSAGAQAQGTGFPNKPIHLIVPFTAGGTSDSIARAVGQQLSQHLGQPVVIENKAGANGVIGLAALAKAEPDGYTVGLGATATVVLNPLLYTKLPFDPKTDLRAVAGIAASKVVLVVNPALGVQNLDQLVAELKKKPGAYNYGSPGVRHTYHLLAELFKRKAGVDMVHVPYKGDNDAMVDLLAGRIQMMFTTLSSALPLISSGGIRAIAVVSKQRSDKLPDVPTMSELKMNGFEEASWFGIMAPGRTPDDLIEKLSAGLQKAVTSDEVVGLFNKLGVEPSYVAAAPFASFIAEESEKWGQVVKELGPTEEAKP